MGHKAGYINIVGNPNVGKSTLMNALVGQKISIITSKAQTTRHRILGIVNGDDFQAIFSDTPGVLKPGYKLQEAMLRYSQGALSDADVLLYVTDTIEKAFKNEEFIEQVKTLEIPIILVINKIDLIDQQKLDELYDTWKEVLPNAIFFPMAALRKFNVTNLFNKILELLPESPAFFDKDTLTDRPARFFATEIIREKILLYYQQEIPYAVEVVVEEFKDLDSIIHISAVVNVERESQKGIIIGPKGLALKRVGVEARRDLEEFFEKKIMLKLFARVEKDWRSKDQSLHQFGYNH